MQHYLAALLFALALPASAHTTQSVALLGEQVLTQLLAAERLMVQECVRRINQGLLQGVQPHAIPPNDTDFAAWYESSKFVQSHLSPFLMRNSLPLRRGKDFPAYSKAVEQVNKQLLKELGAKDNLLQRLSVYYVPYSGGGFDPVIDLRCIGFTNYCAVVYQDFISDYFTFRDPDDITVEHRTSDDDCYLLAEYAFHKAVAKGNNHTEAAGFLLPRLMMDPHLPTQRAAIQALFATANPGVTAHYLLERDLDLVEPAAQEAVETMCQEIIRRNKE